MHKFIYALFSAKPKVAIKTEIGNAGFPQAGFFVFREDEKEPPVLVRLKKNRYI